MFTANIAGQMLRQIELRNEERKQRRLLTLALVLSLLAHIVFLVSNAMLAVSQPVPEPTTEPIRVKLQQPQERQQIVDLPPLPQKAPTETDLLSTQDSAVEQESIAARVGPTVNAAPQAEQQKIETTDEAVEDESEAAEPKISTWKELASALPPGQSAQPNYLDRTLSDVTLLNSKSSPFADYFIERGHRVVRFLDINAELMTWYRRDIANIRLPFTVEAVIAEDGSLQGVRTVSSSGSGKVDRWLGQALSSGFTGRQPPQEMMDRALPDGRGAATIRAELHRDHIRIGIP